MSAYLLNLVFTVPPSGTTNGMFDTSETSKRWYSFDPSWVEPSYGSQVTGLKNPVALLNPVGPDASLTCNPNDEIYIQVLPNGSVSPALCTLGIAFGRASGPIIAAPFKVSDSDPNPCTYFPYSSMQSSRSGPGTPFWVCYLAPVANAGSFGFIVDVSVPGTSGSPVYFGLDPQMDVTPGLVNSRNGGAQQNELWK